MDKHFGDIEQQIRTHYVEKMCALCSDPAILHRISTDVQPDANAPTNLVELHKYTWDKQPEYRKLQDQMHKEISENYEEYYDFCERFGIYPTF